MHSGSKDTVFKMVYLAFCLDPVLNVCNTKQAWASQAYHHSHLNYNEEFRSQISVTNPEKLTHTQNAECRLCKVHPE